jgi:hypothetical protein
MSRARRPPRRRRSPLLTAAACVAVAALGLPGQAQGARVRFCSREPRARREEYLSAAPTFTFLLPYPSPSLSLSTRQTTHQTNHHNSATSSKRSSPPLRQQASRPWSSPRPQQAPPARAAPAQQRRSSPSPAAARKALSPPNPSPPLEAAALSLSSLLHHQAHPTAPSYAPQRSRRSTTSPWSTLPGDTAYQKSSTRGRCRRGTSAREGARASLLALAAPSSSASLSNASPPPSTPRATL